MNEIIYALMCCLATIGICIIVAFIILAITTKPTETTPITITPDTEWDCGG